MAEVQFPVGAAFVSLPPALGADLLSDPPRSLEETVG
jgi:hypothetical protein